eukprot:1508826-Alexandrium_andersonii.AAC.1
MLDPVQLASVVREGVVNDSCGNTTGSQPAGVREGGDASMRRRRKYPNMQAAWLASGPRLSAIACIKADMPDFL